MIQHYYHSQKQPGPVRIELNKGSYIPAFYYTGNKQTHPENETLQHDNTPPIECTFPSLAVLYFKNLSPDPAHGYIADGFTQELLTEILKVKSILI